MIGVWVEPVGPITKAGPARALMRSMYAYSTFSLASSLRARCLRIVALAEMPRSEPMMSAAAGEDSRKLTSFAAACGCWERALMVYS